MEWNAWWTGYLAIFCIGLMLFYGVLIYYLFVFWFLVLHIGFAMDEKIDKNGLFRINLLNIISEKISYLPFTCFPCREG